MQSKDSTHVSRYILFADRFGNVVLSNQIETNEAGIEIEHMPSPSRYLMMANIHNDCGLVSSLIRRWFLTLRDKRHTHNNLYIEINPFLCPITDTLPRKRYALNILNIIRHPADWFRYTKLRSIVD